MKGSIPGDLDAHPEAMECYPGDVEAHLKAGEIHSEILEPFNSEMQIFNT
jgi:hypothetical protein